MLDRLLKLDCYYFAYCTDCTKHFPVNLVKTISVFHRIESIRVCILSVFWSPERSQFRYEIDHSPCYHSEYLEQSRVMARSFSRNRWLPQAVTIRGSKKSSPECHTARRLIDMWCVGGRQRMMAWIQGMSFHQVAMQPLPTTPTRLHCSKPAVSACPKSQRRV